MMKMHNDTRDAFTKLRFPSMNAVASDAWADHVQQALDALLKQIEKNVSQWLGWMTGMTLWLIPQHDADIRNDVYAVKMSPTTMPTAKHASE